MKTSVLLVAGLLFASVAFGQKKLVDEVVVVAPYYQTDIYSSVDDLLSKSIEYPSELKNSGIEGTEVIQFSVTSDGNLTDFNVINSLSPNLDEQIIQTLKMTSGKWNPALVDGNPVSMEKEVAIIFYQHSEQELIKSAKYYQDKGNEWMFEKSNPKKALTFYDRGIKLLPYEESLWEMRSYCKFLLEDFEGAGKDLARLQFLNKRSNLEKKEYLANYNLTGYSEKINSFLSVNRTK